MLLIRLHLCFDQLASMLPYKFHIYNYQYVTNIQVISFCVTEKMANHAGHATTHDEGGHMTEDMKRTWWQLPWRPVVVESEKRPEATSNSFMVRQSYHTRLAPCSSPHNLRWSSRCHHRRCQMNHGPCLPESCTRWSNQDYNRELFPQLRPGSRLAGPAESSLRPTSPGNRLLMPQQRPPAEELRACCARDEPGDGGCVGFGEDDVHLCMVVRRDGKNMEARWQKGRAMMRDGQGGANRLGRCLGERFGEARWKTGLIKTDQKLREFRSLRHAWFKRGSWMQNQAIW